MDEIKPRFEFRVWGDAFEPVHEKLRLLGQSKAAESEEVYLISAATDRCNAKIRAGLMDIKVLVAEDRGLEQWRPILKTGFPLERAVIAGQVFPSLELAPPALAQATLDLDEFLGVVQAAGKTAIVKVRKVRHQFRIGACSAEYSQIGINDVPRDTVAVESTDPDAVLGLVKELGIGDTNTSYVREIKNVLGW
jgi:exopolyphosphatase / guanosine-5'-triphosphate,3'-diphosphate pyrophosphatase